MKPASFEFRRTASLAEALALLGSADGEARVLGGSQSLGPMMNLRLAQPDLLVDISRIEGLDGIESDPESVTIGARVTHARIEDGAVPGATGAYMSAVAAGVSYRSVRNRGTIGGSLAHADPAADWPAALLALGGTVTAMSAAGTRQISIDGFQSGAFMTALAHNEVLTSVTLPQLSRTACWGYYKVCRKPGEFADAIGAVVADTAPRVVCGATGSAPFRVPEVEDYLSGGATSLSIPQARAFLDRHDTGFDDYELQIHAVAISRSIGRAFT